MVRRQPVPPGVQVAPERPHPLFDGFIEAAIAGVDGREPVFGAEPAEAAMSVEAPASEGSTRRG